MEEQQTQSEASVQETSEQLHQTSSAKHNEEQGTLNDEAVSQSEVSETLKKGNAWKYVLFSCLGLCILFIVGVVVTLVIAIRSAKKQYEKIEQEINESGGIEEYQREFQVDKDYSIETESSNSDSVDGLNAHD